MGGEEGKAWQSLADQDLIEWVPTIKDDESQSRTSSVKLTKKGQQVAEAAHPDVVREIQVEFARYWLQKVDTKRR
jgi:hypothetical protein